MAHGYCEACAVGNLVAANFDIEFEFIDEVPQWKGCVPSWNMVFMTTSGYQTYWKDSYKNEAKREIDSTGYTWKELAKIEYAFETAHKGKSNDEWMFNGLMSVIEALDEIHENKDPEVSTKSKNKFAKV